ncbi:hypothetical protein [Haladaptatus sp. NG-WS-4]
MAAVENAIDDGTLHAFPSEDEDDDTDDTNDAKATDETPEECDCDGLGGFPCWECVKTGRKALPNKVLAFSQFQAWYLTLTPIAER